MEYRTFFNKLGQIEGHHWLVERRTGQPFLNIYYRNGSHLDLAYYIHLNEPFMLVSTIDNQKMLRHAKYSQQVYILCSCLASTQIKKRGEL